MVETGRRPASLIRTWSICAIVLLCLEAALLIAFQFTSAPVMVNTLTRRYMPIGLYLQFLSNLPWKPIDLILASAILLNLAAIITLDLLRGSVTALLRRLFARETTALLTTLAFSLVAVRYYFSTGRLTWGADASHHALHTWVASEAIGSVTLPVWTPVLSVGSYFVQFHGFTFAYLSGAIAFLMGDLETGLKLSLGLIHAA